MKIDLNILNTEQQNPRTMDLDICDTRQILYKINQEDKSVPEIVEAVIPKITKLVDAATTCLQNGGRIIYVGAGTSGRLGILDASECPPTYGVSSDLVQGVIAGGVPAIFKAQEGAEDDPLQARMDVCAINLSKHDIVIGLAASGRTPYVIGALMYAQEIGASTGSICCVQQGEISSLAQYPVEAVTGPETITGSTRMKAGTAQKLILNMISTACMVKLGKVYQNLMVDVQPTNEKLKERAYNIIANAIHCTIDVAKTLYEESGCDVKVAIVMGVTKEPKAYASQMLKIHKGNISKVIRTLKKEEV